MVGIFTHTTETRQRCTFSQVSRLNQTIRLRRTGKRFRDQQSDRTLARTRFGQCNADIEDIREEGHESAIKQTISRLHSLSQVASAAANNLSFVELCQGKLKESAEHADLAIQADR